MNATDVLFGEPTPVQTCRSCGARIFWAKTPGGKTTPVDYESQKRLVINASGVAIVTDTHTSHFDTCTNATHHRKEETP